MVEYSELIDAIVAKMITVLGKDNAIKFAETKLSADGKFEGKAKYEDLDKLVKNYEKVAGSVSKILMKGAISSKVAGQDIKLPETLR